MRITFEQFMYMIKRIKAHIDVAIMNENNRNYEKYGYMYCDLCNEYPEYVLKMKI